MSDDESEPVRGELCGKYRVYERGEPVVLFKADKAKPLCSLSNFAVVKTGVAFEGLVYPSVEHAFHAQKYHPSSRPLFSVEGVFGNSTDNFHAGWTAYYAALTPAGDNLKKVEKQKNSKHAPGDAKGKKNTMGVLAKMVNTLCKNQPHKMELLGLRPNTEWDFGETHEELWMDLLRSKYQDPEMLEVLQSTGSAYLIEFQKHEKVWDPKLKAKTEADHVDFYTAYYDDVAKDSAHCNEPRCSAMGKFLMTVRDTAKRRKLGA